MEFRRESGFQKKKPRGEIAQGWGGGGELGRAERRCLLTRGGHDGKRVPWDEVEMRKDLGGRVGCSKAWGFRKKFPRKFESDLFIGREKKSRKKKKKAFGARRSRLWARRRAVKG